MRKLRKTTQMTKDLFNFSDTSDLPAELAAKLNTETTDKAAAWANILHLAAENGIAELDITQIMAVATRLEMEVPKQQTVRNYLNKAEDLGLITKPTRQSYAAGDRKPGGTIAESVGLGGDAVVKSEPVEEASADPLAALV